MFPAPHWLDIHPYHTELIFVIEMRKFILSAFCLLFALNTFAQDSQVTTDLTEVPTLNNTMPDITGKWMVVDDYDKEPRSHVQLFERDGRIFGKVVKLLRMSEDKRCDVCPGDLKDQPLLNMVVVEKMILKGGYFQGGQILDSTRGRWYHCEMWLKDGDPNTLVVRGYVGFYYRTQYWTRVE